VGGKGAGQAGQAEPQRIVSRKAAQPHQGGRDRNAQGPGQPSQILARARGDDPATGIEDRPFGLAHQFRDLGHLLGVGGVGRVVAAHGDVGGIAVLGLGLLHVLGQVDEHGTGPAGRRQVKGLLDHAGQIPHILDEIVVLGAGPRDADNIDFLEGVVADKRRGDLAGNDDDRHGIHVGGGDAGYGIGGSGARGHEAYAYPAGGPGVPVRGVDGALFVPRQDMAQRIPRQLIVDVNDRTSGEAEHDFHALALQGLQKDLGPGEFHAIFPPPCDISSAMFRSGSCLTASFS